MQMPRPGAERLAGESDVALMTYRYLDYRRRKPRWLKYLVIALVAAIAFFAMRAVAAQTCRGSVYLTLDTGSMRHAQDIAAILQRQQVRATFFLAHEKTPRGDYALDDSWSAYWRARVAEGHAFGSHTWRHGRLLATGADGRLRYRPQFGADAGRVVALTAAEFCTELRDVEQAFQRMTGRGLDPLWRAPGGHTTPAGLEAARRCGFAHVHWAPAGFLGDELPSETHPNAQLLARALRDVRDGDVLMAHLGIWSRRDPFAPMLEPLIEGLKARGMCFRTLREHPAFVATGTPPLVLAAQAARQ